MEWIPLQDRLPKDNQLIIFNVNISNSRNEHEKFIHGLISSRAKFVHFGYAQIEAEDDGKAFLSYISSDIEGRFKIYCAEDDFITHWMPLPEPI